MKTHNLDSLDTYIWDESVVTCPKCGARTDFKELAEDKQQHQCLACDYEFFVDFEEAVPRNDEDKFWDDMASWHERFSGDDY